MELIILGEKKDSMQEIEIFSDAIEHPFGFNVILTCKEDIHDGKVFKKEGDIQTQYNVTEYHHLWNQVKNGDWKDRIACESYLHLAGYVPWDIFEKFSKIEVVKADVLHTSLYEK